MSRLGTATRAQYDAACAAVKQAAELADAYAKEEGLNVALAGDREAWEEEASDRLFERQDELGDDVFKLAVELLDETDARRRPAIARAVAEQRGQAVTRLVDWGREHARLLARVAVAAKKTKVRGARQVHTAFRRAAREVENAALFLGLPDNPGSGMVIDARVPDATVVNALMNAEQSLELALVQVRAARLEALRWSKP